MKFKPITFVTKFPTNEVLMNNYILQFFYSKKKLYSTVFTYL